MLPNREILCQHLVPSRATYQRTNVNLERAGDVENVHQGIRC